MIVFASEFEVEDAGSAQQVQPADAGQHQHDDGRPRRDPGQTMTHGRFAATPAALWLVGGSFGVYAYGANYHQYRGFQARTIPRRFAPAP
jgi:hypothetical protein